MLGVVDLSTGSLLDAFPLGEGIDNHCGAAIALDSSGRLHTIVGAHHGAFLYRWSLKPQDPGSWSEPEPLGPADTYPSLVVDAEGTLHLAHRERGERWQLWYRRKRPDSPWEAPVPLAVSPVGGYNHFMQSLTIGPRRALHLTFQYHYAQSGRAQDCTGRMAVYLQSQDGGDTWLNDGQRCSELPLTIDTAIPFCRRVGGGLRIGNHVVDAQGQPWLLVSLPDAPAGLLYHRTPSGWQGADLTVALQGLNLVGGRATALTRDQCGRLYLAVASHPGGLQTTWYDRRLALFLVTLDRDGRPISREQIPLSDPSAAHWLPALEPWDWTRPQVACAGGPWLAYTVGLNAGGIGGDNQNAVTTRALLCRP